MAGDEADVAHAAPGDHRRGVLVERIPADVEVDGVDEAGSRREVHELPRLGRGQRERLLAHHVAIGGEDLLDLGVVQLVGRGDVDDLDCVVGEQFVQGCIGARQAQLFRTACAQFG